MSQKPVEMVLTNRSYVLRTTLGHSINFIKDVPVNVPHMIVSQALAIGAAPTSGQNPIYEEEAKPMMPVDPFERNKVIREVVIQMYLDNNRHEFTASGTPKINAVSARLDFRVDARELRTVMNKINQEKEDADKG